MSYYTFEACRVSGDGNAIFPAEIIIDEEEEVLAYRKPKLIGCKETTDNELKCLLPLLPLMERFVGEVDNIYYFGYIMSI